jgi:L-fuculose-phosphate aldolase
MRHGGDREALVRVARRLDARGILTATDGNLSSLLEDGSLLITPSGSCKGELEPSDLLQILSSGEIIGEGRPSSEIALHRRIYALRADVRAVVHAHPPHATAYAVAGIALDRPILSEVVLSLGYVPVAGYALPTGEQLAESVAAHIHGSRGILLRFHGAVTFGATIGEAGRLMETLEHVAQIDLLTRQLGASDTLDETAVGELEQLRRRLAT